MNDSIDEQLNIIYYNANTQQQKQRKRMQLLRQKVDWPHRIVFVHSHHWGPGNNFAYERDCLCIKNLLEDDKQTDHTVNNSVSFQEGRTDQDCKVLYIVRIKKGKSKIAEHESNNL